MFAAVVRLTRNPANASLSRRGAVRHLISAERACKLAAPQRLLSRSSGHPRRAQPCDSAILFHFSETSKATAGVRHVSERGTSAPSIIARTSHPSGCVRSSPPSGARLADADGVGMRSPGYREGRVQGDPFSGGLVGFVTYIITNGKRVGARIVGVATTALSRTRRALTG